MDIYKNNTEISINKSCAGDEVFFFVTNNTQSDIKLRDIYIYRETHSYTPDLQVVAEGYTMLSQYSGTISDITNFSGFSDKHHYKLRQTDGYTTVYNYAIVENNGKWDLYSFTSCNRFNGRILINENEIQLVIDMENLTIKAGETIALESIYIGKRKSYSLAIAEMGALLVKNHKIKLTEKLPTGWCSWYCFGPSLTVRDVKNNLSVMKNSLSQLTYVQIDDGYQAYMGDWLDCSEHFGDVKEIISLIRENGFEPAIWVAPFIAEKNSKLFREHPDYFIKDKNGNPLSSGDFSFGGWRHGPWYMLDGTNPDAQKYLTHVFKTMRDEWKVKYFKLDANVWGALPCDEIVRFEKNSTTVDAYRKGMEAVWLGAGEDSVILGCNAPMWSSIGAVNAMRTSGDLSRDFGTLKMLKKEIFNRNWMHNVLWTNDPDVLTVQNQNNSKLNEDELEYQRTMIFASSGMILSGDDMTHYKENEFALINKFSVISDYNTPDVRAAVFDEDEAKRTGDRFAVGSLERNGIKYVCMFNDTDDAAVRHAKIDGKHSLTNHWTGECMGTSDGMIEMIIPAHGAKLIEVNMRRAMKIIVTGFEPFGGEDKNPSWEAVKLLPDEIDGCQIIKLELPTEYKNSADAVICKISEVSPDYVIMTGLSGGRDGITPEVIAINYADSSSPDNAGIIHMGEHLINDADAPAAYFSTLPYIDMVKALRESGFKSMPSHSAGAYVCNDTMYRVLHFLSETKSNIRAGFIHVPYSADMNKSRSMPPSAISEALAICIKVCIK